MIDGEVRLHVTIDQQRTEAVFIVSPNVDEVILGREWLSDNNVVWDFAGDQIELDGQLHSLRARKSTASRCNRCVTQSDLTIQPRGESIIPAYIVYNHLRPSKYNETWTTTPAEPTAGLRVARTVIDSHAGASFVRVCNVTEKSIHLPKGHLISQLHMVDMIEAGEDQQPTTKADRTADLIKEMCDKVDPSVPAEVKQNLIELMQSYSDVLSVDEFDLGRTGIVQHRIDTGDSRPFRQPLRPQARAHLPVIDQLISDMQQQGIIEPCQSEWASNLVLVKKKDGSVRFCVDYRKLNDLTKKDAYPLPRIDSCLDKLAGSVWYSTFDLRSGFHQVEMDPKDVNKTTFVCHRGTFRFPRMPFGLCNAPATFQRLMDMVMLGLNFEICLLYLDDIIVFSQDLPTHLDRLGALFSRLRSANLKLKPSKCSLLQTEVSFLGFRISSAGVGTDPDKISAVRDWPTPQNLKQSRAFVGLCQYYRRFVPSFSEISAPLNALTKKGARFEWSPQCQNAFETLKSVLMGAAVLALPSEDGMFVLDTDASEIGIGAVLSQIQNGVERPICYASQCYNKHEKNYNVTRKELLAVVTFTKKFRQYLLGQPFLIRTDHAALQWLKRTPEPIGQQARWLETLEEFDYRIEHRAGHKHCNADGLSRRPHPEDTIVAASVTSLVTDGTTDQSAVTRHPESLFDWPALQRNDKDIGFVHDLVKNNKPPPRPETLTAESGEVKTLCCQLEKLEVGPDDILRRKWRHHNQEHRQIVVPYPYRADIAVDLHKGLNGGHFGFRRAKLQLQRRFYWPGWSKSVRRAQLQCEQCERHKRPPNSRQGQLQPMVVGEPWERIGVDITGPHPISSKGNVYILTMIDHFTKWVEMFPMRNQEASTIARLLVDRVFCTHGCPMQILTDRGQNFESELFQEICKHMSIDKIRTTAYKPSTNGNIERFHATLNGLLAKWVSENQRDWDEKLPAIAFAYRTSVQETTGFTPFYLIFGREARIPADLVYGTQVPSDSSFHSIVDFVASQQQTLRNAFEFTRNHLRTAATRRKDQYDLRTRPHKYSINDWVWCLATRRKLKRGHKWRSPYDGPFQVINTNGPVNVEIRRSARSRPFLVHVDKLKPCLLPGIDDNEGQTGRTPEAQTTVPSSDDSSLIRNPPRGNEATRRPQRAVQKPHRYR